MIVLLTVNYEVAVLNCDLVGCCTVVCVLCTSVLVNPSKLLALECEVVNITDLSCYVCAEVISELSCKNVSVCCCVKSYVVVKSCEYNVVTVYTCVCAGECLCELSAATNFCCRCEHVLASCEVELVSKCVDLLPRTPAPLSVLNCECIVEDCSCYATDCLCVVVNVSDALCETHLDSCIDEAFGVLEGLCCLVAEECTNYHCERFLVGYVALRIENVSRTADDDTLIISVSDCCNVYCRTIIDVLERCVVYIACPCIVSYLTGRNTCNEHCHLLTSYVVLLAKLVSAVTLVDAELYKTLKSSCVECSFCSACGNYYNYADEHHESKHQSKNLVQILHSFFLLQKNIFFLSEVGCLQSSATSNRVVAHTRLSCHRISIRSDSMNIRQSITVPVFYHNCFYLAIGFLYV